MKKVIAVLMLIEMLLFICACGKMESAPTWQEQYDLGVRYLSDGNYEEAIIAFTAAIELDSLRVDAYISLAEAYRGQGDIDMAIETLRKGYEETADKRLERLIEEEERNIALTETGQIQLFIDLYNKFEQGNRAEIADAFEAVCGLILRKQGKAIVSSPYVMVFDGERFCVETDANALLLSNSGQIFYGETKNGVPHGKGIMIQHCATYVDGGITYYWIDGNWENGKAVGAAQIFEDCSSNFPFYNFGGYYSYQEIACVFDDQEIMSSAEAIWHSNIIDTETGEYTETHQVSYTIRNGKFVPNEWEQYTAYPTDCWRACDLHTDCEKYLMVNGFGNEQFKNPFPWRATSNIEWNALYGVHLG